MMDLLRISLHPWESSGSEKPYEVKRRNNIIGGTMMALKKNLFAAIPISMLLIVVVLPVRTLDDNLLLYLTFDSDIG